MKPKLLVILVVIITLIVINSPQAANEQEVRKSRTEKCLECARGCLQRPEIRGLVIAENRIGHVILGASMAFGILCGLIVWACLETKTQQEKTKYVSLSASMGIVVMMIVLETLTSSMIKDLHWYMARLGCSCAAYCGSFL